VIVTVDPAHTTLGETLVTVILVCPFPQTENREDKMIRQNLIVNFFLVREKQKFIVFF
jgi:hypothetical protein